MKVAKCPRGAQPCRVCGTRPVRIEISIGSEKAFPQPTRTLLMFFAKHLAMPSTSKRSLRQAVSPCLPKRRVVSSQRRTLPLLPLPLQSQFATVECFETEVVCTMSVVSCRLLIAFKEDDSSRTPRTQIHLTFVYFAILSGKDVSLAYDNSNGVLSKFDGSSGSDVELQGGVPLCSIVSAVYWQKPVLLHRPSVKTNRWLLFFTIVAFTFVFISVVLQKR